MPCFALMLLTPGLKGNPSGQDELLRLPWMHNAGRVLWVPLLRYWVENSERGRVQSGLWNAEVDRSIVDLMLKNLPHEEFAIRQLSVSSLFSYFIFRSSSFTLKCNKAKEVLNQKPFVTGHLDPKRQITGRAILKTRTKQRSLIAQDPFVQLVMCCWAAFLNKDGSIASLFASFSTAVKQIISHLPLHLPQLRLCLFHTLGEVWSQLSDGH